MKRRCLYGNLKIRKTGNSIGDIFPQEIGLSEGDELKAEVKDNQIIIDLNEVNRKHDLIEESFHIFEKEGNYITEEEMIEKFGKWGWGDE